MCSIYTFGKHIELVIWNTDVVDIFSFNHWLQKDAVHLFGSKASVSAHSQDSILCRAFAALGLGISNEIFCLLRFHNAWCACLETRERVFTCWIHLLLARSLQSPIQKVYTQDSKYLLNMLGIVSPQNLYTCFSLGLRYPYILFLHFCSLVKCGLLDEPHPSAPYPSTYLIIYLTT